jgi:hypothetical protein
MLALTPWDVLRRRLRGAGPALYPLGPRAPASCLVCRGPVRAGFARCYQCARHDLLGHGLLADVVVPVCYAVKGTEFAAALWRYKSEPEPSPSAGTLLLTLLLTFLHDHGPCAWRHAGMPRPGRLAVVPSGCGRPGPHPLLPLVPLDLRPGSQGRDLDPRRFRAGPAAAGASVLLLDDTWVSGASAQSAAAALRLAGACHVAIVVLGRHVNPADPGAIPLAARLAPAPYDPACCAVHGPEGSGPKLDS